MRITLQNDRVDRRVDPVVAREGVFGVLNEDELSFMEQRRITKASERTEATRTERCWTPGAILKRITKLYTKLKPVKDA